MPSLTVSVGRLEVQGTPLRRGGETVSNEEVNMADSEALYRVLPCGCQGAWLSPQGGDGVPPGGNSMARCVREDGIEPGTVAGLEELPAV